MKLISLGRICSIDVEYRYATDDTSITILTFTNADGQDIEEEWAKLKHLLDVSMYHNSIARVKDKFRTEYTQWKTFVKKNEKEFQTYQRLKKKFDS